MSGYASKAEAMGVLRHTIETGWNSKAPSKDVKDYFIGHLFDATFYHRGGVHGWGQYNGEDDYADVMWQHLRPTARRRINEGSTS